MTTARARRFALTRELIAIVGRRAFAMVRARALAPLQDLGARARRAPSRLEFAPPALRRGDKSCAQQIYDGALTLAGRELLTHGRSPFALTPPSAEWALELYGFGWLRHLRAAQTALAAAHARALVDEYLNSPPRRVALSVAATARRVLSLLAEAPMLLAGASTQRHRQFLRALGKDVARLCRNGESAWPAQARLTAAIATTSFALCVDAGRPLLKSAVKRLEKHLAQQILPDGAPIDRNPAALIDWLCDLSPLRELFLARGQAPPPELIKAIDRMTPALRLFQHGDGALALFNGAGVTDPERLRGLLDGAAREGRPLTNARYGGYQRLEGGEALAIIDVGAPPPPEFSSRAHAGCLSFEFSVAEERIIVNCGDPGPRNAQARASARLTAAHSTLTLGDRSSAQFVALFGERLLLGGPRNIPVAREDSPKASTVVASHDGYAERFGFCHERRWRLAQNGAWLEGGDRLIATAPAQSCDFAIRFHLHPSIEATPDAAPGSAQLITPGGKILRFVAEGAALTIEDSVSFAAAGQARPSLQIVLRGVAPPQGAQIFWSLARLA